MGTSHSSNQVFGKTQLHEASERGESEELQRLLGTGAYDVNQVDDEFRKVCEKKEGERVDLLFLPSHLHFVDYVR